MTGRRRILSAATGAAVAAGTILSLAGPAGAAATAICTGHCAWEQLGQPSGYDLNVQGQQAVPGTPIIAWKGRAGNPSFDFTVTAITGDPSPGYQIVYTPYTDQQGAALAANSSDPVIAHEGTEATNAYRSSANGGGPLYCIGVTGTPGAHATLESCGAEGTSFQGVPGLGSHTLFEPNSTMLALNDSRYGLDGSPIIAYQAIPSAWNEELWPGTHNAAPAPPPVTSSAVYRPGIYGDRPAIYGD
jgi:hypothetical protein